MDKKRLILTGGLLVIAVILFAAAAIGLWQYLTPKQPPLIPQSPAQQQDPATVVRSEQITGMFDYDEIPGETTRKKGLIVSLTANGYPLAYDKENNIYYCSVSHKDVGSMVGISFGAVGKDETEVYSLAFEDDVMDRYSYFKLTNDKSYKVRIYTDAEYDETTLVITSMPFLSITTEKTSLSKTETNCTIALQDGDWREHGTAEYTTSHATIRVRGASSAGFPKRPYRLNLKKDDYVTQNKMSLLGLRNDDDWILDAMYNDPTRMHNRISAEIWNEMTAGHYPESDTPAMSGCYVEVIINGAYQGFYDLIEPVDSKQLNLSDEGTLIKTLSWDGTYFDKYKGTPESDLWMGFEMKMPEGGIGFEDWALFYDLLEATADYKKDTDHFVAVASKHFDAENLTDYWIFLNAFYLRDNRGKNLYWSTVDGNDPNAVFYITPWDCDVAYGYRYGGNNPINAQRIPYSEDHIKHFVLLERYLELDIHNSREMLCKKWDTLTGPGGLLSIQNVLKRYEDYFDYLLDSGAWARETKRWNQSMNPDPYEEFVYLEDWLIGRYEEYMPEVVDAWREPKE
ncbi:MAG: CotH kinase family protein [Clostridia bacterium]|nr:CotH kinase family protein [Clostridia bacterium]